MRDWRVTMRYRVFQHWLLVAFGVLSIGLLGWSARTEAQTLGNMTGTVTGIVPGTTTVLGDTGTLAPGSLDALYSEADSISTSLVSADVPSARVIGYKDEIVADSYLSSLNLVIAVVTIKADSAEVQARARLDGTSGSGTSYVSNLSINGVIVTVDGTINQTVSIPGGQLVINEQQVLSDGTMVVNALHANVSGVADAVVVSAKAGAGGGNASAVRITTF